MDQRIVFVDVFRLLVAETSTHFDFDINYMHGHIIEITNSLDELTKSPSFESKKYPGIFLLQDFKERSQGDFTSLDLNFIIAINTSKTLKASDRYDASFKPFLYPIVDRFLHVISRSGLFAENSVRKMEKTIIDRLYWGRNGLYGNTANIFNDRIDCVEIESLKLNAKPKACANLKSNL